MAKCPASLCRLQLLYVSEPWKQQNVRLRHNKIDDWRFRLSCHTSSQHKCLQLVRSSFPWTEIGCIADPATAVSLSQFDREFAVRIRNVNRNRRNTRWWCHLAGHVQRSF